MKKVNGQNLFKFCKSGAGSQGDLGTHPYFPIGIGETQIMVVAVVACFMGIQCFWWWWCCFS